MKNVTLDLGPEQDLSVVDQKVSLDNVTRWRIWAYNKLTWNSHWNSLWAHFEDAQLAHSELTRRAHTVSLLWAFCEFSTSVSFLWDHIVELTMQWLQWAHCEPRPVRKKSFFFVFQYPCGTFPMLLYLRKPEIKTTFSRMMRSITTLALKFYCCFSHNTVKKGQFLK